jgi:hypothetical protein
MAINPYFKKYSGDASVIEELTIETIKAMGHDFIYIPRTLINVDEIFGEDTISKFDDGYELEMYIQNTDGFEGEGDILTKFGLEIRDRMTLVLSKSRFEEVVGIHEGEITKPREGDLVYFPLSKTLFEINFVEHENPFYQLGKLYTYVLTCEVFTYSQEDINTGISDIDNVEAERQYFMVNLELGNAITTGATAYYEGEKVFQISGSTGGTFSDATSTANVIDWNAAGKTLGISNISGTLNTGVTDSIKGASSGVEYYITSRETTTVIIPQEPNQTAEDSGDNEDFGFIADTENIFDFTDIDPFSEGNY